MLGCASFVYAYRCNDYSTATGTRTIFRATPGQRVIRYPALQAMHLSKSFEQTEEDQLMSSSSKVKMSVKTGEIAGFCDPRFEQVAVEYARNFQERGEVGASICVKIEGETVVDLWGGSANPATESPWVEDTLSIVWSCTKGATALCAHMLASRGLLDLDAPVARYWPEFGQAGKEAIPVKMLLNHQSGLAALREPLPERGFYNWELMIKALEKEEPWWRPGSMHGYHGFTFGWLVGEVVRRVSGKSLGTFFRE